MLQIEDYIVEKFVNKNTNAGDITTYENFPPLIFSI